MLTSYQYTCVEWGTACHAHFDSSLQKSSPNILHRYFAQTLSSAGPSGGRHRISLLTRGIAIDSTESVFTMVQFYKIYYILYFECALMDGRKNEGTTVDGILVPIAQITTFHLVLLVVYGLVSVHLPVSSFAYLSGCVRSVEHPGQNWKHCPARDCDEPVKTRTLQTEFQIEAYHSQVSVGHNIGVIRNQWTDTYKLFSALLINLSIRVHLLVIWRSNESSTWSCSTWLALFAAFPLWMFR